MPNAETIQVCSWLKTMVEIVNDPSEIIIKALVWPTEVITPQMKLPDCPRIHRSLKIPTILCTHLLANIWAAFLHRHFNGNGGMAYPEAPECRIWPFLMGSRVSMSKRSGVQVGT